MTKINLLFEVLTSGYQLTSKFLNNGENKERMFELIEQVWAESSGENGGRIVYVARGSSCVRIENGILQ